MHVWVVEVKDDEKEKWLPTEDVVMLTRKEARLIQTRNEIYHFSDKFRVRKYVREEDYVWSK